MSYIIDIDSSGDPTIDNKNDIDQVIIVDAITLADYQIIPEGRYADAKANLRKIVDNFGSAALSQKVVDIVSADPSLGTGNIYKSTMSKLVEWKRTVLKAYVYVVVMENTVGDNLATVGTLKGHYEALQQLMVDSTSLILNLGSLTP